MRECTVGSERRGRFMGKEAWVDFLGWKSRVREGGAVGREVFFWGRRVRWF